MRNRLRTVYGGFCTRAAELRGCSKEPHTLKYFVSGLYQKNFADP